MHLDFRLTAHGNSIELTAQRINDSGDVLDAGAWHILQLTPQGMIMPYSHVDASLGLQMGEQGKVLIR